MTNKRGAPTLSDVAARAGVSTATVSRCLNSPGSVSGPTRTRVMQAVDDLDYTPNFGARMMASRRTRTIGAIVPTMDDAAYACGLHTFQVDLQNAGYALLLASTGYDPSAEMEQAHALLARGAEAILLVGHRHDAALYDYLHRQAVPVLAAWSLDATLPCPSVGVDNRAAMQALATEVIAIGHRQIATISGPPAQNDHTRECIEGIHAAMFIAGLDPAMLRVIETPYSIGTGAAAFEALMQEWPTPTAVLCSNDVLAAGALGCARAMGIDVPGRVSITGFGDIDLAQTTFPALTTVHIPHREIGRAAATALLQMVDEGDIDKTIALPTSLRWRATVGPPPMW
ncbi:LacI family DNA-binding transcriptional regulator [Roseovarius pelagicus]|uniref:LacI family DNA-binding transcriptional regulator n=1 Tax=Roseovarius pelagicus TaxID=2980108 RepID=A0ABY6D972_9RHOB|nr:LacI family DNA-binding transcriptional regulator [Roseovarius pelagicus]UXX82692.1 LacI family DNA-binding transcriptional regulator [Roseovarius pelagicus]